MSPTLLFLARSTQQGKAGILFVFIKEQGESLPFQQAAGSRQQAAGKMGGRGRAQSSASLLLFSSSLGLVLLLICFNAAGVGAADAHKKTWCVAKPSASNEVLLLNLNYACSQVSCAVIQKGGPCYHPDNLVSHAAVAMNLYYAANGRHSWNCYFQDSALVVQSDPSYGSCTYY